MSSISPTHLFHRSCQDNLPDKLSDPVEDTVQLTRNSSFSDLHMENDPAVISNEFWLSRDGDRIVKSACEKAFEDLGKEKDVGFKSRAISIFKPSQAEKQRQCKEFETKRDAVNQHLISYAARKWDLYLEQLPPELARKYASEDNKRSVLGEVSTWLNVSSGAGKSALESAAMKELGQYNLTDITLIFEFKDLRKNVRDSLTQKQFIAIHRELNNIVDEYCEKMNISVNGKSLTCSSVDEIFNQAKEKLEAKISKENRQAFQTLRC